MSMKRLRDEILEELSYWKYDVSDIDLIKIRLVRNFRKDDYYDYVGSNLNEVENLEYDNGFGLQHLYGYIWLKDGSWMERHEYDGSEWWVHPRCPDKDIDLNEIVL